MYKHGVRTNWANKGEYMESFEEQCHQKSHHDNAMEDIHEDDPTAWGARETKWIVDAKAWYAEFEYVPTGSVATNFANYDAIMEASPATTDIHMEDPSRKRAGEGADGNPPKREKPDAVEAQLVAGPYYTCPREHISFPTVPEVPKPEDKDRMRQVRAIVTSFNEKYPNHKVPPVPSKKYSATDQDRWLFHYHMAIELDHGKWGRLPSWDEYIAHQMQCKDKLC